jgi:2-oxo-hept-3-ene-1,7-dioate hydratase
MNLLTDDDCRRCAENILSAERTRRPAALPSRTFPGTTLEDAYRIQRLWLEARLAQGRRVAGYKIGLTSLATQRAWQAAEPMYGRILDDAIIQDGARISAAALYKPRLEVELAFILGGDLAGPDVNIERVLAATDRVVPAFEIIAHRTEAPRPLVDAVADNAAFAAIALGRGGVGSREVDLACISATLERNGIRVESGVSSSVMDHPAAAVVWLARALHAAGARLERGQVLLTGTLTRAVELAAGDAFRADYGALGSVEVSFD